MFEEEINKLLEQIRSEKMMEVKQDFFGKKVELTTFGQLWLNGVELFVLDKVKEYPLKDKLLKNIRRRSALCLKDVAVDLCSLKEYKNVENIKEKSKLKEGERKLKEYDVFLSHASVDKKDFVDPLYKSLIKAGIRVFYDKEELDWGDNLEKIIEYIDKSEFGIIVISKSFFDREWPEKELKSLFEKQNTTKQTIILPILKGVTIEQFRTKYPLLSNIIAIDTKKSTEEIALLFCNRLIKRLKGIK